jgi:thiamine-phosphate pyrophosphorylase
MIPKLHYHSKATTAKEQLEHINKACSSGAELIQLNLAPIPKAKRLSLAEEARKVTAHFQTRLVIVGDCKIAKTIKADGLFVEDSKTCPLKVREQLHPWQTVGAMAHTVQDCERLIEKEVDYMVLGPFRTENHTESTLKELGLNGFTAIVEALNTETPILGFGGITTDDVTPILETGISGLVVSDTITADFNKIKEFHTLLSASATQEQRHSFEK